MNLPIDFFRDNVHTPLTLDSEQVKTIKDLLGETTDRHVIRTRPYKEGPGRKYAEEVISAFHKTVSQPTSLEKLLTDDYDTPPRFSYELWFQDGHLEFMWTVPDDYWYEEVRTIVTGNYPRATLTQTGSKIPRFKSDSHLAGGRLRLYNNQFVPIKSTSRTGHFDDDKPPLRLISSEIAGQPDTTAVVQVLFEPAPDDWRSNTGFRQRPADTVARHYEEGNFVDSFINPRIEDPTDKDLRIAREIREDEGAPAFYTTIRYLVFAPRQNQAQNHAATIGNIYRTVYENKQLNQRFEQQPLSGGDLFAELGAAITRTHTGGRIPLTVPELAAVAHIPNADVETPSINWTRKALTSRVPSEAPRKPETIDPRPYEEFGPEVSAEDHLSATAPQLPPADGDPEAPPDERPLHERRQAAEDCNDNAISTDANEYTTEPRPGTYPDFGRPQNQIDESRQSTFDRLVTAVRNDELTFEEIEEKYTGGQEVDNLIRLIKREIKWRETAADGHEKPGVEQDDTEDDNTRVGRQTAAPNNLPTKPDDYGDYGFTPAAFDRRWMRDPHTKEDRAYELKVKKELPEGDDGQWFMGRDVKNELFDIHQKDEHTDCPLWLGWMKDNRVGVREVGLPKKAWFRHMTIFGMTGTGKSTFENNLMNQIARKGYGFIYVDPKGDGAEDVIRQIPQERIDNGDVIWIEPGSVNHDKVVGINFLEPAYEEGHPRYDREVSSIVDDLTAVLKNNDYWGPKMEGITTNLARAMIRSDINYTLLDMYFVLFSQREREAFAQAIERERQKRAEAGDDTGFVEDMRNIQTYTKQIARMDQEEVDAVIRRIQHWIEDPIARGIVAHRDGTVNITDAVEDGKIIIASIDVDSDDIKEVVTTALMRRVWATISKRDGEEHQREPFFTFVDEFDAVVTDEMNVEKMLSKARSGKMGVNLACQNPSQIPEGPLDQMFNNARTLSTFSIGGDDDARLVSRRLGEDIDSHQLHDVPQFNIYTRVVMDTEDGAQLSPPLALNTFADYPPERSREEAHEIIDESLEEHGVEPLEESFEDASMILYDMGSNINVQVGFLQSVWEVQIERDEEYVALSAVDEAFHERVGRPITDYPGGITIEAEWVEVYRLGEEVEAEEVADTMNTNAADGGETEIADGGFTQLAGDENGEISISELNGVARITEAGKSEVLTLDEYRAQPSDTHRELLGRGVFEWFTRAGFTVNILPQVSNYSDPDAEGLLPVESSPDTLADAEKAWTKLQTEMPNLSQVSKKKEVAIEAEVSLRKPAGPLKNIARAANNNRRPIFIVPDGRRESLHPSDVENRDVTYWAERLYSIIESPRFVKKINLIERDDGHVQTIRELYNTQEHLSLTDDDANEEKFPLIRNESRCVWQESDGEWLTLYDGDGEDGGKQRGRIAANSLDDASVNSFETWCRYDTYEDEWVVYPERGANIQYDSLEDLEENWQRVYRPFHPETEFDGDIDDVDPLITVLREPEYIESVEDSMPAIYTHPDDRPDDDATTPSLEPLIPEAQREDWNTDLIPGYDPVEHTPEFLQESDGDTLRERLDDHHGDTKIMTEDLAESDGSLDAMDSFPDYDPDHEPSYDFGGKDPTARHAWRKVWEFCECELEEPLDVDELRDGLENGLTMLSKHHEPAIKAGVDSGQLIPSDIGYFLTRPEQRPRVIVGDVDACTSRQRWANIWNKSGFDESDTVPFDVLRLAARGIEMFTGEENAEAVIKAGIQIGVEAGALEADGDTISLGVRTIPDTWKALWEELNAGLDAPIQRQFAVPALRGIESLEDADAAEAKIQDAINKNILYETDAGIRINDPETDDGPPLDPDTGGDDNDDDNDDGGSGAEHTGSTSDSDTTSSNGQAPDTDESTNSSSEADTDGAQANDTDEPTRVGEDRLDAVLDDPDSTDGSNTDSASGESTPVDISLKSGSVPVDYETAPGVDASSVDTDADDDASPDADSNDDSGADSHPDDESADGRSPHSPVEQWDITPTEAPPDGWQAAFETAIDCYHDRLDDRIGANIRWNTLINDYRDRVNDDAGCSTHNTYVAECRNCIITAPCVACADDDERAVARVEWEHCGCSHSDGDNSDSDVADPACADCQERHYCPNHAADRRETTSLRGDTTLTPGAPVEYIELVTGYSCESFNHDYFDEEGADCYCTAHTHTGPLQRLPETARDYFTGPEWDPDTSLKGADYANDNRPHRHRGTGVNAIGRGWSDEIVDDRRLGWAPGTPAYEKPVATELIDQHGHTVEELLATGLFTPHISQISRRLSDDDDSREYSAEDIATTDINLRACIDDPDHPLEATDVVKPYFSGRPIFPSFNGDSEAVFAYARQQPGRPHPDDYRSAKYLKLSVSNAYVYADEPIYGADALEENTPTIITEGVADAIAAQDHGLPCLSPVTTRFKDRHHGPLLALLEAHNIDTVLLIQDNEPGSFDVLEESAYDTGAIEQAMTKREAWLDSDAQSIQEHIDAADGRGPIGQAMEIDGVGPGLAGALSTGEFLEQNGIDAIQVELPRFGNGKVDLDDYLTQNICQVTPPLQSFQLLLQLSTPETEAAYLKYLTDAAQVTDIYETAVDEYLEAHDDELPDGAPRGEWPSAEKIRTWYEARRDVREATLPAADPDRDGDDFTMDAVQQATPPDTFDKGFLGTLLSLGDVALPVPELVAQPRQETEVLCKHEDTTAVGHATDLRSAWVSAVNEQDNRAATVKLIGGDECGFIRFTPLFSGPTMYTPSEHPKFEQLMRDRAKAELDREARASTADGDGDSSRSGGRYSNQLFNVDLRQVSGKNEDYRGKNPLGHTGNSENYYVMLDREAAYDHKRKALYNALTYMAVEAGARDIRSPSGTFTDQEILETWVHARKQHYVGSNAKVPNRGLNAAAIEMGIAEPSDLIRNKQVDLGDDSFTLPRGLPGELYNETVEQFKEYYGEDSGRSPITTEADFEHPDVTEENSLEVFGELYLDDDPDPETCDYDTPRVSTSPCWEAYEKWCEINDIDPLSKRRIREALARVDAEGKGKRKVKYTDENGDRKDATANVFVGVKMTPDAWTLRDL